MHCWNYKLPIKTDVAVIGFGIVEKVKNDTIYYRLKVSLLCSKLKKKKGGKKKRERKKSKEEDVAVGTIFSPSIFMAVGIFFYYYYY